MAFTLACMIRIYLKLLAFPLPAIAWMLLELCLPSDTFTFRHWEATRVFFMDSLPGPFYPNYHSVKWSKPDSPNAATKPKLIAFTTDKYGFRNAPAPDGQTYDYVFIGDSNIAGSNLDQKDTLPEVMARSCNCNTYNYGSGAPYHIISYVNDPRFLQKPPPVVVFQVRVGDIECQSFVDVGSCVGEVDWTNLRARSCTKNEASFAENLFQNNKSALVLMDRLLKFPSYQKFKSVFGIQRVRPPDIPPAPWGPGVAAEMRLRIHNLDKILRERGSRMILLVMPTTERKFDSFLRTLEADGISVVFWYPNKDFPDGENVKEWWSKDDSHWREASVIKAAHAIEEKVRSLKVLAKTENK